MSSDNEDKPGLLHHLHPHASENPYDPDAREVESGPAPEIIERASGDSHHGIIRDRDPLRLGREEEAKLALENTEITPAVAWIMTVLFLLTLCIPPVWQSFFEIRRNLEENRSMAVGGHSSRTVLPQIFEVVNELPALEELKSVRSFSDITALMPDAERIKSHEATLENEALLVQWMLPRAQYALTKWGGVGNEQAYVGRGQWLFYRPDVDYLTSPGFLDPALQRVRARGGDTLIEAVQSDPVKAIALFKDQLSERGIQLIVMPVPVKPMLHPDKINRGAGINSALLQNPSYGRFVNALKAQEINVFDATKILQARKRTDTAVYLETDTHWTPEAMEAAAQELARFIIVKSGHGTVRLSRATQEYSRDSQTIENLGDIAVMLNLPERQDLFKKQSVVIHRVFDTSEQPWRADKSAEVLLLGDSFSNIYSHPGMGWGSGAGFAEQLSFYLKRPLDSVVVNAGGSHTSRQRLISEVHRAKKKNQDRLGKTKLVIWEFSMRDLLIGDWKLLNLPH